MPTNTRLSKECITWSRFLSVLCGPTTQMYDVQVSRFVTVLRLALGSDDTHNRVW